jgi:hypothetical protein
MAADTKHTATTYAVTAGIVLLCMGLVLVFDAVFWCCLTVLGILPYL